MTRYKNGAGRRRCVEKVNEVTGSASLGKKPELTWAVGAAAGVAAGVAAGWILRLNRAYYLLQEGMSLRMGHVVRVVPCLDVNGCNFQTAQICAGERFLESFW